MIDLEESHYTVEAYQLVMDCDYGLGESYVFKHAGRVFAVTYYKETEALSLLDVTDDPSYSEKEQTA